jgi:DNA-binding SARP family transcriptional activator/TolB-like protein
MLYLRLLGGISVLDEGVPVATAMERRRPAALLALIGAAGDRGISRDKAIGLLWPETESSRARHSLTQALYAIRRATGVDDVVHVAGQLRLNTDRIRCDVPELERAMETGDFERAVELYGGPFLDGFYIAGAAEFEQWASGQRTLLDQQVVDALGKLATDAESAGRIRAAIPWRQRQALMRPLDSDIAMDLMRTMAAAGDRAGAIRHAQAHANMLREQLELPPDVHVEQLVAALRTDETPRVLVEEPARITPIIAAHRAPIVGPAALSPDRRRVFGRWRSALAIGSLLLLLTHSRPEPARHNTPPANSLVAVTPFRVAGSEPSLAYLRNGLAELIAARIGDETDMRSVDAGGVMAAWRRAGVVQGGVIARDSVLELSGSLGASRAIVGSVVGTPARVVVTATLRLVRDGTVLATASAEGRPDSVTAIADSITARLLAGEAGVDRSLADQQARALPAFRAFLGGRSALRRGDRSAAVRRFEAALASDTSFARAALELAEIATRLGYQDRADGALARAWSNRATLDVEGQARLASLAGHAYPHPSRADAQLVAWARPVEVAPRSATAWFDLATQLVREGRRLGAPDVRQRATEALEQALALDSTFTPARDLLAFIEPEPPNGAAGVARSGVELEGFLEWRRAVSSGGASTAGQRELLPGLDRANLRMVAMSSLYDAAGIDDGLFAARLLRARATTAEEQVDAVLAEHSFLVNAGRFQEALVATEALQRARPELHAHLRLRAMDAIYAEGDTAAAAAAVAELSASAAQAATISSSSRQRSADLCVVAQWRLAHDDTTGVETIIAHLLSRTGRREGRPVSTPPVVCAAILETWRAVVLSQPQATTLVNRLDSLVFTRAVAGYAAHYSNILIARLFMRLGQPTQALAAIRKRGYMNGWPSYLVTTWREEARLAELVGNRDVATAAARRYAVMRPSAHERTSETRRSSGIPRR